MSTKEKTKDMGEFTISDEFYEISEATNPDGTINVDIYDYEKVEEGYDSPRVKVHFRTRTLDEKFEIMEYPRIDSTDYKFVRICEKTVGSMKAAQFLKTDEAEIKADPDDWTLIADLTKREELRKKFDSLTLRRFTSSLFEITTLGIFIVSALLLIGIPIIGLLAMFGLYPYAVSGAGFTLWAACWLGLAIGGAMIPVDDDE